MNELKNETGFVEIIKDWINNNQGKAIGIGAGLLLGILLLTVGVVKSLLIFALMALGYWLGRSRDENTSISEQITGLFKKNDES